MSPEQASGSRGAISTATDVYGLGTILYALLAGRAPFAGTTLVDTLEMVRTQTPEAPSLLNTRVPRDLEIICLKCLEKEPQRRYQSAQALAEDLERWLERGADPGAAGRHGNSRAAVVPAEPGGRCDGGALLVLALLGGIAGVAWKWREADRERVKTEAVNELLTQRLLARASLELDPRGKDLTVPRAAGPLVGAARRLARGPARSGGQNSRERRRRLSFARSGTTRLRPHVEAALRLDDRALRCQTLAIRFAPPI